MKENMKDIIIVYGKIAWNLIDGILTFSIELLFMFKQEVNSFKPVLGVISG